MTTINISIPVKIKHFIQKNGKLRASIAYTETEGNRFAVAISRCNKKDQPSRKFGRELALSRLQDLICPLTRDWERFYNSLDKNLVGTFSASELESMLIEKPFLKFGCPFGVDENHRIKKTKAKAKNPIVYKKSSLKTVLSKSKKKTNKK